MIDLDFENLPAMPIIDGSGKKREKEIFSGFVSDYGRYEQIKLVGIRVFGRRSSKAEIEIALNSATKPAHSPMKKALKRFFLACQSRWAFHFFRQKDRAFLVVWNGIKGRRRMLSDAAKSLGHSVYYFEESPFPNRLTIDTSGVNYGSGLPRIPAFYRAWMAQSDQQSDAWRKQGEHLVARKTNRQDVGQAAGDSGLAQENYIFCPLQVPGDSQITIYGGWIKSVEHMIDELKSASDALPDGWHLRIKEHPSAKVGFADKLREMESDKFRVDNVTDTFQQVQSSQAVLNINSSVGLQAFFYDKPVIVLGQAFYGIKGLVHCVGDASALRSVLSDPKSVNFDSALRDAFMTYLDAEYYPAEDDVKSGKYTSKDVDERDKRRDAILADL
ncbi:hypothetical protein BVC71_06660 [Marivivens niveibacter]|uniref:Capsular biosynthesis protein n=1 Tax=Marivivens niveibacter TaxID=1930667 RepID=A0A251WYU9_9RHOB|nr:hypothetical protein [Marivivens niveibacter]OUD09526.1 hypothetical protein BVC71_06660 [Marivivens niveibacter]